MKILYIIIVVVCKDNETKTINLYIYRKGVTMRQKQIDESIQMIVDGFFSLLSHMHYHDITMSDVANEAKVSRMTLYRYFKNKDDIVNHYIKLTIEGFKKRIETHTSPNFMHALKMRNQLIYEDEKLRTAFKHDMVEHLFKEVIEQSKTLINAYLPNIQDVSKYKKLFVEGGITNITKDWVHRGMSETPDQITFETIKILLLLSE